MGLINKIFGSHSQRELKRIYPIVDQIIALEDKWKSLSDEELRGKTEEFKSRLSSGETLDDILPEAFATVREAADRVLGMRHYPVQLVGGIVLHQGRIAEMKTGEGKTLVATLPAYLNALAGNGVHIVTVNDYLAKRDSEWMGKVHRFLGLKVGLIVHGMKSAERREAYAADITYGTNNEMGFDYLRDNMAIYKKEIVQRGHAFAIVDEVDSILIDEARTPLIISGQGDESTQLYQVVDNFASTLKKLVIASSDEKAEEDIDIDADYIVDEKARSATLTARGVKKAEQYFNIENLSDIENTTLSHHINQAIRARGVMKRDVDYVVRDGQVIIVDEFTGRLMFGRRYSEGLHQAIEAKEKVQVARESKTLATITFQNYFRLYSKLSGMTGTALTEQEEFSQIYKLDVVEIPTNKPMIRIDDPDVVYKTEAGKMRAIIAQIEECHKRGQPVLVGTVSIEKSEMVSKMLQKVGIKHNVLNAKHHEKEAEIVAQAGKFGAVTIATNMAGRGTDIMLGGNPEFMAKDSMRRQGFSDELISEATGFGDTEDEEIINARNVFNELNTKYKEEIKQEADAVRKAGGLFIIGTERHESRRIDNQLRGRSGRQGDPGESRFYLAMTDDIMRLFGSERVMGMMNALGIDEDTPIDQKILSNAIESAQSRVESRNFQARKNVLEYDDVMNKQREIIYGQRKKVLDGENLRSYILTMTQEVIQKEVNGVMAHHKHIESLEQLEEILVPLRRIFLKEDEFRYSSDELDKLTVDSLTEELENRAVAVYEAKEKELGETLMRELERVILLRVVDEYWMDHIDAMQELRRGMNLRAMGKGDPVTEYKREGFEMFGEMIDAIRNETVRRVFVARVRSEENVQRQRVAKNIAEGASDKTVKKQPIKKATKVGRNDPCPCGKWKADGSRPLKYKECCGRNE